MVSDILGLSLVAITGDIDGHASPDIARQAVETLGDAFDVRHRSNPTRWRLLSVTIGGTSAVSLRRLSASAWVTQAEGKGRLMVVAPPREAPRGRSGSLRTRPLDCGVVLSG